jgi:hypothetical protein
MYLANFHRRQEAGLAQSVERQALNLMVEGSSPSFGVVFVFGFPDGVKNGTYVYMMFLFFAPIRTGLSTNCKI